MFFVFWVRASVPRLRIDQLMSFSWKILLPLMLVQVLINGAVLVYGGSLWILTIAGLVGVGVLAKLVGDAVSQPRPKVVAASAEGEVAS
jgi:NADH-quinone oxidoreductase subunit H